MCDRKVTIAAIFICQLTLVPETLMSNNQAIFNVAINSLNAISENCSDKSTELKKTYTLAISDLTSVFYQQTEKITELEVDNVHLKDEIEYLKEELGKSGDQLRSRAKREPMLTEYKEWPGFPGPSGIGKHSNEQGPNGFNILPRIFGENINKNLVKTQEGINMNRIPDVPYVLQRIHKNDYMMGSNHDLMKEIPNSLIPIENQVYGAQDQLQDLSRNDDKIYIHRLQGIDDPERHEDGIHNNLENEQFVETPIEHPAHQYGFYDVFNIPYVESNFNGKSVNTKTRGKISRKATKNKKSTSKKKPNNQFRNAIVRTGDNQPLQVNIVEDKGKLTSGVVVHLSIPDGTCEIVHSPETEPEQTEIAEQETIPSEEVSIETDDHVNVNYIEGRDTEEESEELAEESTTKASEQPTICIEVSKETTKPVETNTQPTICIEVSKETTKPVETNTEHKKARDDRPTTPLEPPPEPTTTTTELPMVHLNLLKPFHKEQSEFSGFTTEPSPGEEKVTGPEDKKVHIHYIGVEGDSMNEGAPNYWVYPQDGDNLFIPEPDDWDNADEEMLLDNLPEGPWVSQEKEKVVDEGENWSIEEDTTEKVKKFEEDKTENVLADKIEGVRTPYERGDKITSNRCPETSDGMIEGVRTPHERGDKITSNRCPETSDGMIEGVRTPHERGDKITSNRCPETSDGMSKGHAASGTSDGLTFASVFKIPPNLLLSGSMLSPETQKGLNVYGNYIALSLQNNPKLLPSSSRILNQDSDHLDISSAIENETKTESEENEIVNENIINKEEDFVIKAEIEEQKLPYRRMLINKERSCPQLSNLNNTFCNCTPCNEIVTKHSIVMVHPECKNLDESKTLHQVVKMGCSNLVDEIINKNNVNEANNEGLTALHIAAERGYTDIINTLIKGGADINATDYNNNTALHYCASGGSANACSILLSRGCDVKAQNLDQATALHIAVWKGNYEIVRRLLNYNDSFEITDNFGRSASDLAHEMDNEDIIELLEKSGIKSKNPRTIQNFCGRYPSNRSAISGELITCPDLSFTSSTVSEITASIPETREVNKNPGEQTSTMAPISQTGVSTRQLSEKEQELFNTTKGKNSFDTNSVTKLCEEGLDINVADIDSNNSTALHFAASVGVKLSTLILIRCGADVNVKDIDGNTPLHLAVMNGKYWVADILLHNKADPFVTNNNGETPQKLAHNRKEFAMKGLFDTRLMRWYNPERKLKKDEAMIHQWAKTGYYLGISAKCATTEPTPQNAQSDRMEINVKNIESNLTTALHLAVCASKNNLETVLTLLRCGSDIHSRDVDENTPLHLAVICKHPDVVVALLMNNADPLVPNKEGKTAYQLGLASEDPMIKDTFSSDRYSWYMRHIVNPKT